MRVPELQGLIRRRLLVNFRAAPDVVRGLLPAPFRPKTHGGQAVVGICLIRLESMRPSGWPAWCGLSSENAAHRIAVEWDDDGLLREGVYIPRRHSGSWLNRLAGGRLFPGEQCGADFHVRDDGAHVSVRMRAQDGRTSLTLAADDADTLPAGSCFGSLAESSAFFAAGSLGYSAKEDGRQADGLALATDRWEVRPLAVRTISSSFFEDRTVFPEGSIAFDHALIMRDIPHRWMGLPNLPLGGTGRRP